VKDDRPQYDWNTFLRVHGEVERIAAQHTWLQEWKKAGTDRSVEAHIVGETPYWEEDLDLYVTPAWKHAGLKGKPNYELLLRHNTHESIQVFFGAEDDRALVTATSEFEPGPRRHWLDRIQVSYHPTQKVPEYVVINRDGTWKRNTRPKHQ
jgi:hypothetical protein